MLKSFALIKFQSSVLGISKPISTHAMVCSRARGWPMRRSLIMKLHTPATAHIGCPTTQHHAEIIFATVRAYLVLPRLPNGVDKFPGADILNSVRPVSAKHICGIECTLRAKRVVRSQSLGVHEEAYYIVSYIASHGQ